jgi:hypothetical protein
MKRKKYYTLEDIRILRECYDKSALSFFQLRETTIQKYSKYYVLTFYYFHFFYSFCSQKKNYVSKSFSKYLLLN